jgi:hypothetical protein
LAALREAADLYATNRTASGALAVNAAISYLRAVTDNADRSVTTPLMHVLSHLVDDVGGDTDKDGNRQGKGNTKPIMESSGGTVVASRGRQRPVVPQRSEMTLLIGSACFSQCEINWANSSENYSFVFIRHCSPPPRNLGPTRQQRDNIEDDLNLQAH